MKHLPSILLVCTIAIGCIGKHQALKTDFIEAEPKQVDQEIRMATAIDNLQDAMTWMREDIQQGRIDAELGNIYIYNMNEAEDLLIEYIKNK